ncbi:MAG: hypothetical protein K1X88_22505 [Nannocystaceae bacterium]|nr:hypothetical protein [Nannocystaceae bacterium]
MTMRKLILTTMALGALASTGCSVAYSSIRQQPDGSYLLTESKSKFFKVQGTMYSCTANGETMNCKVVALPSPKKK